MRGYNGESGAAELQPVSQETLQLLYETVYVRCPRYVETIGNGGIMWKGTRDGRKLTINLDCYGEGNGPPRHDADGSMAVDTTGRYKHFRDGFYYDTGVQATISRIEKADESKPESKKLLTSYEITRRDGQLEIEKRVRPFGLPIFTQRGNEFIPARDNPPLITAQERQTAEKQEDELELSTVSESEANGLIELLRGI